MIFNNVFNNDDLCEGLHMWSIPCEIDRSVILVFASTLYILCKFECKNRSLLFILQRNNNT